MTEDTTLSSAVVFQPIPEDPAADSRQGIQELLSDGAINGANGAAKNVGSWTKDYQELTGLIRQKGLLAKQPGYYALDVISVMENALIEKRYKLSSKIKILMKF